MGVAVSLQAFVTLPTATHGLGAGGWTGGVRLPIAVPLSDGFSLGLTPEVDVLRNAGGGGTHAAWIGVASLSRSFGPLTLGAELWGQVEDEPAGTIRRATADLTAAYMVGKTLQLDAGANFGLNRQTAGRRALCRHLQAVLDRSRGFQTSVRFPPSASEAAGLASRRLRRQDTGRADMKALLSKVVGGPETLVLEDVPSPEAKPGHAVISVKAIGVNFPDVLIIEDKYQFKPAAPLRARRRALRRRQVGRRGRHQREARRPDARPTPAGAPWPRRSLLPAARLWKIPDAMPLDEAAAFILTYGTSYHALKDRGHLKAGETLLVLGAAGGVGLSAVELGKAMGARVIAACSTQEKVDLAIEHGADERRGLSAAAPSTRTASRRWAPCSRSACGPNGADVIYDAVGGDYAEPALRSIAWEGRYLVIGFAAGESRASR